jgi:1-deoxy-D-xylulose-5-phosphate synthase
VTFAAGLAAQGMKPVVAVYSTFLQRAYDQIIHDVCLQNLPVRFMIDRGGLVGDDGPTHHGVFDLTYLRAVPNMVLMAPADENELASMVRTAIEYGDGPIAVRYPRGAGYGVRMEFDPPTVPIGRGELLRSGTDVCLVAVGSMVRPASDAAEELSREGVGCSVLNARFVKPLDHELITSEASRTRRIVTIEENAAAGGFGSAVLELLQARGVDGVAAHVMGLPDRFVEHGARAVLAERCHLSVADIVAVTRDLVAGRGRRTEEGSRR